MPAKAQSENFPADSSANGKITGNSSISPGKRLRYQRLCLSAFTIEGTATEAAHNAVISLTIPSLVTMQLSAKIWRMRSCISAVSFCNLVDHSSVDLVIVLDFALRG